MPYGAGFFFARWYNRPAMIQLIILFNLLVLAAAMVAAALSVLRGEKPISLAAAGYTLIYILAVFAVGLIIFYMVYGQLPLQRELFGNPQNISNPTN